jgi:flagellar biogenesis protein FliO
MFDSVFGAEGSLIVRFVVAFVIVLGLIALTFWLVRRFGATRVGAAAARGRQPRLAVVDAAPVDGRRRLVLVRRDNVEHLLMIGGPSDIVVEQNIVRAVPVTQPREGPVPRTPGAIEAASATRPPPDEWPAPQQDLPPLRSQPDLPRDLSRPAPRSEALARPEALGRPDMLARTPRPSFDPLARPGLPPGLTPRPSEAAPIVPAVESDAEPRPAPAGADAALANMAQRLEAALRRPGAPGTQPEPPERPDFSPTESPATAPNTAPARADDKAAKSKSVLDSLEEEMASLLGRPPGKE